MHLIVLYQLFELRTKYIGDSEIDMWKDVTQELMSDEEDNGDALKVKSPHWRCLELNRLIEKLDQRHQRRMTEEARQVLRKKRIPTESPMKRKPSKKLKKTLVRDSSDSDDEYN